jgi:hypothetical protein
MFTLENYQLLEVVRLEGHHGYNQDELLLSRDMYFLQVYILISAIVEIILFFICLLHFFKMNPHPCFAELNIMWKLCSAEFILC